MPVENHPLSEVIAHSLEAPLVELPALLQAEMINLGLESNITEQEHAYSSDAIYTALLEGRRVIIPNGINLEVKQHRSDVNSFGLNHWSNSPFLLRRVEPYPEDKNVAQVLLTELLPESMELLNFHFPWDGFSALPRDDYPQNDFLVALHDKFYIHLRNRTVLGIVPTDIPVGQIYSRYGTMLASIVSGEVVDTKQEIQWGYDRTRQTIAVGQDYRVILSADRCIDSPDSVMNITVEIPDIPGELYNQIRKFQNFWTGLEVQRENRTLKAQVHEGVYQTSNLVMILGAVRDYQPSPEK